MKNWLSKYQKKGQVTFPGYQMPRAASESTRLGISSLQRNPEVEREIALQQARAKQAQLSQGRAFTPAEERARLAKNRTYALQNAPYVNIDEQGNLSQAFPDASMTGELRPGSAAAKTQKGLEHMLGAMEAAGALQLGASGARNLFRNFLRKQPPKKIIALENVPEEMGGYEGDAPEILSSDYWRMLEKEKLAKEAGDLIRQSQRRGYFNPDQSPLNSWFLKSNWREFGDEMRGVMKKFGFESTSQKDVERFRSLFNQRILENAVGQAVHNPVSFGEAATYYLNPLRLNRHGGIIKKDDRGQWAHPGEITEIGSNRITMQGVPYPVLGISNTGDTQMMFPEQEYKFEGDRVTEIPMAQKGKKLPPVYVNNPNDPRLKLYNDSLSTFKKSQNPWFWEGTKVTTKQDYKKKKEEERKFPHWSFDEDQYKKDKKKGKVKDFNDYVYDVNLADKPGSREADAYQRNIGKNFEDLEEPIEKKLPDGTIKQYWQKYKGKLMDDQYVIYDPVTGSSSYYRGNNFLSLYNPNIKPIGHVYHAFDKPYNTGSIHVSSEDSEYVNKVLKNQSKKKKDYTNYTYGANDTEIYKEPVQPVIYDKKKYNPNDPRLKQLQESFEKFHSRIKGKSKSQPAPKPEEPTLKKRVGNVEPIESKQASISPTLRTRSAQDLELGPIQRGEYRVSYFDPNVKDWGERAFMTQEESDRFANEMSQRGYPGAYGNVTQTKKVNKKEYGGPLKRFHQGKMTGPGIFQEGGDISIPSLPRYSGKMNKNSYIYNEGSYAFPKTNKKVLIRFKS